MRSPGEGSLYFRKSTGRWYAEITLGYDAGGKRQAWRFSDPKKSVVVKAMQQRQGEKQDAEQIVSGRQPTRLFLKSWLKSVSETCEAKTLSYYQGFVRNQIIPAIGDVPLGDLKPLHLRLLLTECQDKLAPSTVHHIHATLRRALNVAVRWQLLTANPMVAVDPPRVPKREQLWLDADQSRRFLAAARDDALYAYWVLALTAGLRPAELAGLKWQNVDLDASRIQVVRSLGRVPGVGFVDKGTKSGRSRGVRLIPMGVSALREHRARQAEQRLAAGAKWRDRGLVFCTGRGGPLDQPNIRERHFLPILERAGLPTIRQYDLRHSCASLLVSLGIHVKVVSEILGHSSSKLTMDTYSHVSSSLQDEAMEHLGRLLDG